MVLDAEKVRTCLAKLRQASPRVFGAESHGFALNDPLPEEVVTSFERQHRVLLPAAYRHFITTIGNGGAGPFNGVFPLGMMDSGFDNAPWQEQDGIVGMLAEPFPHRDEWNDLSSKPSDEDFDSIIEKFDEVYWNSSLMNGAIPICHTGCALRIWLVVTGEQAGHLWHDGRADHRGIVPMKNEHGAPLTFARWYEDWLDLRLREARLA